MISDTRIFRLGKRLATWVTPNVKDWHERRNANRLEGLRHLEDHNWPEAEKYLTLALAETHHSFGQRVELLLGLEKTQRNLHKLADAEQTVRQLIDAAAKDHAARQVAMEELIDIQLEQEKFTEAQQTAQEIIDAEQKQSKPDQARLARCSRTLSTALLKSGRKEEAIEGFQRAATLAEQAYGANHLDTASSLAELGALQREYGDPVEARRCYRRALEIHQTVSGPDSREATDDLHHLAALLEEAGDLKGAVAEYERVLALFQRQVGGNREAMAETQVRLAVLYLQTDRNSAARELLTHSIGVLDRKGGEILALALETFARADEEIGRMKDANRWREKAAKLAALPAK